MLVIPSFLMKKKDFWETEVLSSVTVEGEGRQHGLAWSWKLSWLGTWKRAHQGRLCWRREWQNIPASHLPWKPRLGSPEVSCILRALYTQTMRKEGWKWRGDKPFSFSIPILSWLFSFPHEVKQQNVYNYSPVILDNMSSLPHTMPFLLWNDRTLCSSAPRSVFHACTVILWTDGKNTAPKMSLTHQGNIFSPLPISQCLPGSACLTGLSLLPALVVRRLLKKRGRD